MSLWLNGGKSIVLGVLSVNENGKGINVSIIFVGKEKRFKLLLCSLGSSVGMDSLNGFMSARICRVVGLNNLGGSAYLNSNFLLVLRQFTFRCDANFGVPKFMVIKSMLSTVRMFLVLKECKR